MESTPPAVAAEADTASIRLGEARLVEAPGVGLVRSQCTVCHSARLIVQQRADRAGWERMLRWMQKNHNLWQLAPRVRAQILDYLAANYGRPPRGRDQAAAPVRRRPLPRHLLPPTAAQVANRRAK